MCRTSKKPGQTGRWSADDLPYLNAGPGELDIKGGGDYTASQLLAGGFDLRNTAARLGRSGGARRRLPPGGILSQDRAFTAKAWRRRRRGTLLMASTGSRCRTADVTDTLSRCDHQRGQDCLLG